MRDELFLAVCIGGVLTAATAIGLGLKRWIAHNAPHAEIDNLNTRILAWWVLAILLGLALLGGRIGVTLLFALASWLALREFTSPAADEYVPPALHRSAFFLLLPAQFVFAGFGWQALHALALPALAGAALLLAAIRPATARAVRRYAWGVLLCVYPIAHVPALLALNVPDDAGRNAFLVLFLVLVVQASDVLQYVFGKLCGRHKIAPAISPGKTWEGFAGGVLSATALGTTLYWITPFGPAQATAISATITLLGFGAGLVFSAIKRSRGIKDWSNAIPGHGGMLDRLDSLCFAAPVFFYVVRYGWST